MSVHSLLDDLEAALRSGGEASASKVDVLGDLQAAVAKISLPVVPAGCGADGSVSPVLVHRAQRRSAESDVEAEARRPLAEMLAEQHRAEPTRLPWPSGWLDRHDSVDAYRCRALWAEVLRYCLADVCRDRARLRRGRSDHGQPVPLAWLGGRDFRMVCDLAGMDPAFVEDRVRPYLETAEGASQLLNLLFPSRAQQRVAQGARGST